MLEKHYCVDDTQWHLYNFLQYMQLPYDLKNGAQHVLWNHVNPVSIGHKYPAVEMGWQPLKELFKVDMTELCLSQHKVSLKRGYCINRVAIRWVATVNVFHNFVT